MGGKKKSKGGKGKKADQEEDFSTETLQKQYRKKCVEHGVRTSRQMNENFDQYYEEAEHIKKVGVRKIKINRFIFMKKWDRKVAKP